MLRCMIDFLHFSSLFMEQGFNGSRQQQEWPCAVVQKSHLMQKAQPSPPEGMNIMSRKDAEPSGFPPVPDSAVGFMIPKLNSIRMEFYLQIKEPQGCLRPCLSHFLPATHHHLPVFFKGSESWHSWALGLYKKCLNLAWQTLVTYAKAHSCFFLTRRTETMFMEMICPSPRDESWLV